MTRPFQGIRIVDATHLLASRFAACQFGLMGAEAIKLDHPARDLDRAGMGTRCLTQNAKQRCATLDLKRKVRATSSITWARARYAGTQATIAAPGCDEASPPFLRASDAI